MTVTVENLSPLEVQIVLERLRLAPEFVNAKVKWVTASRYGREPFAKGTDLKTDSVYAMHRPNRSDPDGMATPFTTIAKLRATTSSQYRTVTPGARRSSAMLSHSGYKRLYMDLLKAGATRVFLFDGVTSPAWYTELERIRARKGDRTAFPLKLNPHTLASATGNHRLVDLAKILHNNPSIDPWADADDTPEMLNPAHVDLNAWKDQIEAVAKQDPPPAKRGAVRLALLQNLDGPRRPAHRRLESRLGLHEHGSHLLTGPANHPQSSRTAHHPHHRAARLRPYPPAPCIRRHPRPLGAEP